MAKLISLVFFVIFLRGCGGGEGGDAATETAVYNDAAAVEKMDIQHPEEQTPKADTLGTMLIKRGNLAFQVNDVEKKHQEILQLVERMKGYVANDQSYVSGDQKTYNTQVRLPKENYDLFVAEVSKGISHFDNQQVTVEDVTEEYVDISARLKTKSDLKERYTQLLSRANTVTEMLEIEKQIGELQAEIESIEGRMKYLSQQVKYSTLDLNYYERITISNRFGQSFVNGFKNGWNNLVWFLVGLVNIWPFIFIFGIIIAWLIWWRRKRRRNP